MKPRSAEDVEGPWTDPQFDSGLIARCRKYWSSPVTELPNAILATYLRQEIAPGLMIPEARRRVSSRTDDGSEMYEGELRDALQRACGTQDATPDDDAAWQSGSHRGTIPREIMKRTCKETMRIHVVPGVDAHAAARDLLETGAVGIDDIAENMHDLIQDEILEELGNAADGLDLRVQRVDTAIGPVFILRDADRWSAAKARNVVLSERGRP